MREIPELASFKALKKRGGITDESKAHNELELF